MANKKEIKENMIEDIENNTVVETSEKIIDCNILYWNKHSKIIAFDFEGIPVQMKSSKDFSKKRIVKVSKNDDLFEII